MNEAGIIVLDKPINKSSGFITRLVCRKIKAKKAGHLGTLDPFATGVLPIAINDATKLIHRIKVEKKVYVFEIVFGEKRNTADVSGQVVEVSNNIPYVNEVSKILSSFVGEIKQKPNMFSAIKINGKRAYKIARLGQIPDMKERIVNIFSIELLEQNSENSFILKATVGPGTYIRTLAEDIAAELKSLAYVKNLRRIVDGQFTIEEAITMEELEKYQNKIKDILKTPLISE